MYKTKRRDLLKLAGLAPLMWAGRGFAASAASDPSRVALVIGNNAYAQAPLSNPVNDANAFGALLSQANFSVDLQTDISRAAFLEAVEQFGKAMSRSETQLGLFYFAGHGAQVSWKNYLLPVDATVASQADLTSRCLDLSVLLNRVAEANGKTFVLILDACRNDPFGADYRTEQLGLSQFDAPVGSLLAYATAPGSVASDGTGSHGLYTGHLLKEFAAPETSIEDALKRVRLNVRMDSGGTQIPWESTSLEQSIFLFPNREKLSDAEIERRFEAELAVWSQIRRSTDVADWVQYLRTYPNGRFAEIAQVRINRLLAPSEHAAPVIATTTAITAPGPAAVIATAPLLTALEPVIEPPEIQPTHVKAHAAPGPLSQNPYSAGTHSLVRNYKIGDEIIYRLSDVLTGVENDIIPLRVTRVDEAAFKVEFNNGSWVADLNGNIEKMGRKIFEYPVQIFPAELQIGKKWTTRFKFRDRDVAFDLNLRIRTREQVRVPAGEFDTFKIEALGWSNHGAKMEGTYWVAPGLNAFYVKRELWVRNDRRIILSERHELTSYKQ